MTTRREKAGFRSQLLQRDRQPQRWVTPAFAFVSRSPRGGSLVLCPRCIPPGGNSIPVWLHRWCSLSVLGRPGAEEDGGPERSGGRLLNGTRKQTGWTVQVECRLSSYYCQATTVHAKVAGSLHPKPARRRPKKLRTTLIPFKGKRMVSTREIIVDDLDPAKPN